MADSNAIRRGGLRPAPQDHVVTIRRERYPTYFNQRAPIISSTDELDGPPKMSDADFDYITDGPPQGGEEYDVIQAHSTISKDETGGMEANERNLLRMLALKYNVFTV